MDTFERRMGGYNVVSLVYPNGTCPWVGRTIKGDWSLMDADGVIRRGYRSREEAIDAARTSGAKSR